MRKAKTTQEPEASSVASDNPAARQAYRRLVEMILRGELAVGAPIREASLSQQLGLNRGAVREALNQLVAQDTLTYTPYCGYRFADFTIRDSLEWYQFRMAIEPSALEQALHRPNILALCDELERILDNEQRGIETGDPIMVARSDLCFHLRMVEASGNRLMTGAYMRASLPFIAALVQQHGYNTDEPPTQAEYCHTHMRHVQLLNEIRDGEPEKAVELLRRHIYFSCSNIKDYIVRHALEQCPVDGRLNADSVGDVINTLMPTH